MEPDHARYDNDISLDLKSLLERQAEEEIRFKRHMPSIFRVPKALRKVNKSSYSPRLVAIGPIHRGEQDLKEMEEYKATYMHRLFRRKGDDMLRTMDTCRRAVLGTISRCRASYAMKFRMYEDIKFAEMIVLDGCFILEFLYRFCEDENTKASDPLLSNLLVFRDLQHDLMLLENQIPFFSLQILFNILLRPLTDISLSDLILKFLNNMKSFPLIKLKEQLEEEHHHILGFFQECCRPSDIRICQPHISDYRERFSASKLHTAGLIFKCAEQVCEHLDVKYSRKILELPHLHIDHFTQTLLRNLIAYEHCSPAAPHFITSYAFLMSSLIHNEKDVELLLRSKILENHIGSHNDIFNLFDSICKEIFLDDTDFYYAHQLKQVDDYCRSFVPKSKIGAVRGMNSLRVQASWKLISLIGVTVIFILTLLQAIYTVPWAH